MTAARPKNHEWLALTTEAPLEPERPICDPHHHLWDLQEARLVPRYLLDEILVDTRAGHNIVSTVFIECGAMFKPDGPEAMRPIGETEFVNGIAAMSASGIYGPTRVAAGIVGTADLRLGAAVGARARRADRRGRRPLPRDSPGRSLGRRPGRAAAPHQSGAGPVRARRFPGRLRPAGAAPADVRGLDLSPPDPGRHRAGPRVPRHHDHPESLRGPARRRARTPAAPTRCTRSGARRSPSWRAVPTWWPSSAGSTWR